MNGNQVGRTARAAARRLAPDLGPEIEPEVEAALNTPNTNQYFDPISLGSLIISVTTLAWTIYNDLRSKSPKPEAETIEDRVRGELSTTNPAPSADLDKILKIIVDEIINDPEE